MENNKMLNISKLPSSIEKAQTEAILKAIEYRNLKTEL